MRHSIRNLAALLLLSVAISQPLAAQTTPSSQTEIEKRIDSLLAKMTLEQKIELIGGENTFFTHPFPEFGIPSLKMSDGPMGVHDDGTNHGLSCRRSLSRVLGR